MFTITERKLTWAFGLTLVVLAGNALISYSDLMVQAKNTPLVVRSREVLQEVARVGSAIKDAESARRGFSIDGNPQDLAAFEVAARDVEAEANLLIGLTESRPEQQLRSRQLETSSLVLLDALRRSIVKAQDRGSTAALGPAGLDPIRKRLAGVQVHVTSIEADEARYLADLLAERRAWINRAFVTFSVASTLALIAIGPTYALVRRYLGDRRRAEQTLEESEARMRLLFDSVGEGIYGIDTDGCCTFCNPSALKLLGFQSVDQVLGRDMHQLIHHTRLDGSAFPPKLCPIHQTVDSGEGVLGIEDYFFRADGLPIPVEYRAHAIRRGGEILGAVVTFVDIAPKQRAQTEMRLRDRALKAIGQGVFITDPSLPNNPIIYANAAFERLTGYGQADWTGPIVDLLESETSPSTIQQLQAAIHERREATVEMIARRKDGSTFWQSMTLAPIEERLGRVGHFVGVITDVSERRKGEQKLRHSESRLRLMLESVRDYAIFSVDLDRRVSSWNSGAERLFGLGEDEIVGQLIDRMFSPEDQAANVPAAELAMAAATGRSEAERRQVRGDGTRFLAGGLVTAIRDEMGVLIGYTKVARDITESKRVETELRAAKDAAESAIRAKSTFLSNMGHEFRTPLNAIIGFSEMLEDEAAERGMVDFVPDLKRIRESGYLLLNLINNVLDLSKIEAGRMDLSDESFDVAELVRSVVQLAEPLAEQQGTTVQVDYSSNLGTLNADFAKVSQGLSHLLSNAIKFTKSGTVVFRASRASDEHQREWVFFTVADDGIGMTREEMSRLFQPFVQADGSTARRFGGTGLGLTLTHRFCEMMGGGIEVESRPGAGSTFVMKLPANRTVAPTASSK